MADRSLSNKMILMILPREKFQEEEYRGAFAVLTAAQAKVMVASSQKTARGGYGSIIKTDLLISEVDLKRFDAVILIGGVGSIEYWHNDEVIDLIKDARKNNKLICAICLAPVTLANAGLLKNVRATGYNSAEKYLGSKGAIFTGKPVEISDKIITASCPEASGEFARAIVDSLSD
jgi:protease I